MKFYDKNRELHDTRAEAVKANIKNTFGRVKNKLPFKKKDKDVIAEKDVDFVGGLTIEEDDEPDTEEIDTLDNTKTISMEDLEKMCSENEGATEVSKEETPEEPVKVVTLKDLDAELEQIGDKVSNVLFGDGEEEKPGEKEPAKPKPKKGRSKKNETN